MHREERVCGHLENSVLCESVGDLILCNNHVFLQDLHSHDFPCRFILAHHHLTNQERDSCHMTSRQSSKQCGLSPFQTSPCQEPSGCQSHPLSLPEEGGETDKRKTALGEYAYTYLGRRLPRSCGSSGTTLNLALADLTTLLFVQIITDCLNSLHPLPPEHREGGRGIMEGDGNLPTALPLGQIS